LGDIFGAQESDLLLAPVTNLLIPGDSVILPDNITIGINKAPQEQFSFVNQVGWRATGDQVTDQVNMPFSLGQPILVRRVQSQPLELFVVGYVLDGGAGSIYVQGGDGTNANDAFVSLIYPEPVSLDASGLYNPAAPASSVIMGTQNILLPGDQLLSLSGSSGFNLAPEQSYFYLQNQGWRQVGSASTTTGEDVLLNPGQAYIIRKKAAHGGVDWTQNPGGN
jgi:uncharacterized protein (TIGR02597 family)